MSRTSHSADSSAATSERLPTHCVFRLGTSWLALPALTVREVLPRPEMVMVPGTPRVFVGLSHVRSEFIPVLKLSEVLPDEHHAADGRIMMILDDADGAWAILVDEVATLQPLEISDAPETDSASPRDIVSGWATFDNTVLQVLDPARIRGLACQALSDIWRSPHPLRAAAERSSAVTGATVV